MITISINLSKIPRDKIKVGTDGMKYCNFIVVERKEPDAYGNTHYVAVGMTKEERQAGAEKIYCGSGKEYNPQPQQPVTPEAIDEMPPIGEDDGLPF